MPAVTIKDVARQAGVSPATASRVLSGHSATSAEARQRVEAAVSELQFRPNGQARSLRSTRTNTIGLLLSDIRNPFFADLAHAAEQQALAHGLTTLLGNANESISQQDRYLESLLTQRVDGLIVAPQGDGTGGLRRLLSGTTPTVFVDRTIDGIDVPSVTSDNQHGVREAVRHLAERGHTRIGFIAGPQATSTGRERLRAFEEIIRQSGLDSDPCLVATGDFQAASGAAAARQLLTHNDRPTAILVADSPMTFGALATFRTLGVEVGRDVALIGYDDIDTFAYMSPPLTVISHSVGSMGRSAVDLLLQVIDGVVPESLVLPSTLIVRDSTPVRGR